MRRNREIFVISILKVLWLLVPTVSAQVPPVLDDLHSGWKSQHCNYCHALPVTGHSTTDTSECAGCHGGNGACDPNGTDSSRKTHAPTDDCVSCHSVKHDYTLTASCVSCHFATDGVVDCAGGSTLPTDLVPHCFNWPDEEFSLSNKASVKPSVSDGDTAIDFTLKTTSGISYTLSDLLKTKPVLMVFGSYT